MASKAAKLLVVCVVCVGLVWGVVVVVQRLIQP
jgi:hypothetical protein